MNRTRLYSAIVTLCMCVLILLWLVSAHVSMRVSDSEWPPKHTSEITMEEYAEIIDLPRTPAPAADIPAPAPLPEEAHAAAEPTPESGHDVSDAGQPAEAPATVTSRQPSPVKAKPKEPKKTGPSAEELRKKKEEEEARRRATANTQNAFRNAGGKNNTASPGRTPGNAGAPSDKASALNGRGTGSAGGGWMIPAYGKVPSTVTGSVKMMLKIDRTGRVTSVTFQGGDAPAATDPAVRRAVEAEVRARRFTRADDNAPEESTAYVTYTFRQDRTTANKFGSNVELKVYWKLSYNIYLRSRMYAFSDYHTVQADWENTIVFEINKFLTTQVFAHARYDSSTPRVEDSRWHKLQFKEILSIGFAYKFSSL